MGATEELVELIALEHGTKWDNASKDEYYKLLWKMLSYAHGEDRAVSGQLSYMHDTLGFLGSLINGIDDDDGPIFGISEDDADDN